MDTHVLLWALGDRRRLEGATLSALETTENDVLFSAASIWEIAIKSALRRADFGVGPVAISDAALDAGFIGLPVRAGMAARVADLPLIHRDPFDRLLIAQTIMEPAIFFTAPAQLLSYSNLAQRVGV